MKVDLGGKVALVTGSARGIGKAIADSFVANGATVVFSDIDFATARESASARGCQASPLDVTDRKQIESTMSAIRRDYGRLDILVNNAGVNTLTHRVTIEQFPDSEWQRILNVDLNGVFHMSKAAVPLMLE